MTDVTLPARRIGEIDWAAYLILPVLALVTLPMMSFSTWLTLTVAGAAMGMMLFLMASGLTLIFGLMGVLNFAHGAFITLGAYIAVTVIPRLGSWTGADSWLINLAALAVALIVAVIVNGGFGFVFERVIIRRVYGEHLRQILITVGGLIIAEQLFVVVWGPDALPLPKPTSFRGSVIIAGAAIEKYRLVAVVLGLAVYAALHVVLNRTRVGLLVRAGVENREMVEALGYRIKRLFVGVFVAGTALAGVGGVMWALYQEQVNRAIGGDMTILVFIILIIGGLGSIGGCFVGAILVGLMANYVGFLAPKLALGSNILLMVLILLWRPRGLFPVTKE
ncbi:MAG TPA: branched-chain amino acid ABC transporter permease [Stellaceae bacterium]|nr:branched-chain amino acid ABC transporter permease [Stellaceae bacterium]